MNQPAADSSTFGSSGERSGFGSGNEPTVEGHAEQMRSLIGDAMGADSAEDQNAGEVTAPVANSSSPTVSSVGAKSSGGARSPAPARRGPTVHRYNIGTWSTFHAARIAARGVAGVATRTSVADQE
jgi:hypothetical protein